MFKELICESLLATKYLLKSLLYKLEINLFYFMENLVLLE